MELRNKLDLTTEEWNGLAEWRSASKPHSGNAQEANPYIALFLTGKESNPISQAGISQQAGL